MALTKQQILSFYSALRSERVSIKDWCEASGISTNLLYQELGGHRKWVEAHERMVRDVVEYYERERAEPK